MFFDGYIKTSFEATIGEEDYFDYSEFHLMKSILEPFNDFFTEVDMEKRKYIEKGIFTEDSIRDIRYLETYMGNCNFQKVVKMLYEKLDLSIEDFVDEVSCNVDKIAVKLLNEVCSYEYGSIDDLLRSIDLYKFKSKRKDIMELLYSLD